MRIAASLLSIPTVSRAVLAQARGISMAQTRNISSSPSSDPDRFEPIYANAEWSGNYVLGGFHPAHLGDVLDGRYRVFRKLGHGATSTSWLSRDAKYVEQLLSLGGSTDTDCSFKG